MPIRETEEIKDLNAIIRVMAMKDRLTVDDIGHLSQVNSVAILRLVTEVEYLQKKARNA